MERADSVYLRAVQFLEMNSVKLYLLLATFVGSFLFSGHVRAFSTVYFAQTDSLIPKVFIKGDMEDLEDLLTTEFPKPILYPFKNNVQTAFFYCAKMLWEMENFGDEVGYDVRGIKAFVTFYFDRKGQVRHIAYSLKGNSRYFNPDELEAFFIKFMARYRMQITSKYNFQHEFLLVLPYPKMLEKN